MFNVEFQSRCFNPFNPSGIFWVNRRRRRPELTGRGEQHPIDIEKSDDEGRSIRAPIQ